MNAIQPIETRYKGYRLRSRLEARWAVFFDAADIRFEYEPNGFRLNGRVYLPDFFLPAWDIWAEVKPTPQAIDWSRVERLAAATEKDVLVLTGTPAMCWYPIAIAPRVAERWPASRDWADLGYEDDFSRLYIYGCGSEPGPQELGGAYNHRWKRAVEAARSARFEFGQRGAG